MALQPIDLQTLFTQMDKVAKNNSLQREGLQITAHLQQLETQRKAEEQIRAVNETQNMDEEAERVKNDNKRRNQYSGQEQGRQDSSEDEEAGQSYNDGSIRDNRLGRNIDISG